MTLNLGEYFDRIGYGGAAAPNLEVLQDLVGAHTKRFPSRISIRCWGCRSTT